MWSEFDPWGDGWNTPNHVPKVLPKYGFSSVSRHTIGQPFLTGQLYLRGMRPGLPQATNGGLRNDVLLAR